MKTEKEASVAVGQQYCSVNKSIFYKSVDEISYDLSNSISSADEEELDFGSAEQYQYDFDANSSELLINSEYNTHLCKVAC
jgi:hypothetical protein